MAVEVVELLEVIDVDHHAAQLLARGQRDREDVAGEFVECAPVEDAGQRITRGQTAQFVVLLLDALARGFQLIERGAQVGIGLVHRGDVVEGDQAAARATGVVGDRRAADQQLGRSHHRAAAAPSAPPSTA